MRRFLKVFVPITIGIVVVSTLINSCKPQLSELAFNSNGIDFSRNVSLGGAFTSGYADGALYNDGQNSSYPAILAKQFKIVGGGDFSQPLVNSDIGVGYDPLKFSFTSKYVLKSSAYCNGVAGLFPVYANTTEDINVLGLQVNPPYLVVKNTIGNKSTHFNNMGVPGMRSFEADLITFGDTKIIFIPLLQNLANPFYAHFASEPGMSTVLQDAASQNPTFFTLWVGADDILDDANTGDDPTLGSIPSLAVFDSSVIKIVAKLKSTATTGVIANIPDISDLPFFTTIPYNSLTLTQEQADTLNLPPNTTIHFTAGANAMVIQDGGIIRKATSGDYILLSLPLDSVYCGGWGSAKPLADKYVLTSTEVSQIRNATNQFNAKLKQIATDNNLAFVDAYTFFKSAQKGIIFNGVSFSPQFIKGGIFSLDGITLNPQGNAMIANEFIKAINLKYNARIPLADVNAYHGIIFP